MLTAKQIQKYSKKTIPQLRKLAGEKFRKFIRERDKDKRCISCGTGSPEQAGHFYSAGHYPSLEFNEDNVHGQCVHCNYYEHANLILYRINLVKKIGIERVEQLELLAATAKRSHYKHDRYFLIEVIGMYA